MKLALLCSIWFNDYCSALFQGPLYINKTLIFAAHKFQLKASLRQNKWSVNKIIKLTKKLHIAVFSVSVCD